MSFPLFAMLFSASARSLSTRKLIILSSYDGLAVGIVSRTVSVTIFNSNIHAADTKKITRGIKNTASYQQIFYIYTSDTVISCFKKTILYQ